jgi:spermidine/putrescine transport system permease protein
MTLPFVLWAIIFIVLPLCLIAWYGITVEEPVTYTEITLEDGTTAYRLEDGKVQTEEPWQKKAVISFQNFKRMVEPTYLKLLLRSLKIALITTLICLILGYPVALILTGKDFKHPTLWLLMIILPMWMNFLLRTYSWMSILENSGILNSWISALRNAIPAFDNWLKARGVGNKIIFLYNEKAVILGMVYNYLSFMIMPIYTVIEKIDRSLLEAAADLGASPTKSFIRVTLPYSLPGVLEGITMVFVPAVTTFVISQLMGGGKVPLIGDIIQNQFGKSSDWHFGASLSLLVMVVVLAFMRGLQGIDKEEESMKEVRIF